jgi:hypothetical protein
MSEAGNRKLVRERGGRWNPFRNLEWAYVGRINGRTDWTNAEGETTHSSVCHWVLCERSDGRRRFVMVGDGGSSEYALSQEAAVEAWLMGGPVPENVSYTPPKPRKPKPKAIPKPQAANVIAFPKAS